MATSSSNIFALTSLLRAACCGPPITPCMRGLPAPIQVEPNCSDIAEWEYRSFGIRPCRFCDYCNNGLNKAADALDWDINSSFRGGRNGRTRNLVPRGALQFRDSGFARFRERPGMTIKRGTTIKRGMTIKKEAPS